MVSPSLPSFLLPCSHVIFLLLPLTLLIQSVYSYQIILPTGPLPRVSFLLTKLWLLSLSCILTLDSVRKAAHQSLCTFVSPLPFASGSSLLFHLSIVLVLLRKMYFLAWCLLKCFVSWKFLKDRGSELKCVCVCVVYSGIERNLAFLEMPCMDSVLEGL